jgi:hypothetical protein
VPNPNRPNTGEPIPAEWGQLVADRVIRRYRSREERDVDMAGVGDLTGQLLVIAPPGVPPWFEQHDGEGWRRTTGGPLIGGALMSPPGTSVLPPADGSTWGQVVQFTSGGVEAFGSDSWDFPGDRRILIVPLTGFYRIAGYLKGYNHGYSANWWFSEISRVFPSYDAAWINNPANRVTVNAGGNPNMAWVWLVSDFSALVPCNAGDGLTHTARFDVVGASNEEAIFSITYEGDLPPGYVVQPVPRPPAAGLEAEEEDRYHGRCEYWPRTEDMGRPLDRPGPHA